jgi:hypothetical protein
MGTAEERTGISACWWICFGLLVLLIVIGIIWMLIEAGRHHNHDDYPLYYDREHGWAEAMNNPD